MPVRGIAAALCALLLISARPSPGRAQGMPVHMPTALPLPLTESGVRLLYQHFEMGSLLRNGRVVGNADGLRVGVDALALMVPYGVTPQTILMAGIPYVRKTVEGSGSRRTNAGLGDAFLLVKQELSARDFVAGNRRLALFAGLGLPTGETEADGDLLPVPLRLGGGTVDLTGQLVYSYVNDRTGVHGAAAYATATSAVGEVRVGDRFRYDLAFGYRIFPSVYRSLRDLSLAVYLELNGTVEAVATQRHQTLPDSGGHTVMLSPGLQLLPLPNWAIDASLQLPLLRDLHGTQLGQDWSIAVGVRTVFFPFGP
ncbi:MAG: transporter [Gemmatimonadetes bacterium]|nr:transporter [Gemmatimonadota bacterium]